MAPKMDAVAKKYSGSVRILKINGELFHSIMSRYCTPDPSDGQLKFPTIVVFKGGKKLTQMIGGLEQDGIEGLVHSAGENIAEL
jgi:thiol-disulfide isomerase/thioredoxin